MYCLEMHQCVFLSRQPNRKWHNVSQRQCRFFKQTKQTSSRHPDIKCLVCPIRCIHVARSGYILDEWFDPEHAKLWAVILKLGKHNHLGKLYLCVALKSALHFGTAGIDAWKQHVSMESMGPMSRWAGEIEYPRIRLARRRDHADQELWC